MTSDSDFLFLPADDGSSSGGPLEGAAASLRGAAHESEGVGEPSPDEDGIGPALGQARSGADRASEDDIGLFDEGVGEAPSQITNAAALPAPWSTPGELSGGASYGAGQAFSEGSDPERPAPAADPEDDLGLFAPEESGSLPGREAAPGHRRASLNGAPTPRATAGRRARRLDAPRKPALKLARAVAEIRALEDEIEARANTADQLIRRMQSRGLQADAGFVSAADFEQRCLSFTPALKAMRATMASAKPRSPRGSARRARGDARARRTRALGAIATAIAQLRELDADVCRASSRVREAMRSIDAERLFEECGYNSYEEFLERAIGESAVLATAMAMADQAPEPAPEPTGFTSLDLDPPEPEPDPFAPSTRAFRPAPSPAERDSEVATGLFDDAPTEASASAEAAAAERAPSIAPKGAARPRRALPLQAVMSVVACVVATFGGAQVGIWRATTAAPHPAVAVEGAPAPGAPSAVTPARTPSAARQAAAGRTPQPARPALSREPDRTAAAERDGGTPPRSRPAGVREAHR